jgi:hypothetical protein
MNGMGKEKMARKISVAVKKIVTTNKETQIMLVWKDKFMGKSGRTEERRDISESKETEVRSSGRSHKRQVTRRDDFLWTLSRPKEM